MHGATRVVEATTKNYQEAGKIQAREALGTLGNIALVDFSQYAIGLSKEVGIDKYNAQGWTEYMTDYRMLIRVDGQGTWNKAITP